MAPPPLNTPLHTLNLLRGALKSHNKAFQKLDFWLLSQFCMVPNPRFLSLLIRIEILSYTLPEATSSYKCHFNKIRKVQKIA